MNLIVCNDYEAMSRTAAEHIAETINVATGEHLISFPGGDTPLGMVGAFVQKVNDGTVDTSRTRFVQLDEWVGLGVNDKGSCTQFNTLNLLSKLHTPFRDVHLINGLCQDPHAECAKLGDYITRFGPLALSVLGIGLNGHLGFNEEGVNPNLDAHVIPLSDTTRRVMGKYFDTPHPLEYGITQGLRQIMAARHVILIANGAHKASILKRALTGPVTPALPASILQRHPRCTVILDTLAAAELKEHGFSNP